MSELKTHVKTQKQFTIVVAIRDTDKEFRFMKKSLPSAIKLEPNEIIIALDKPASPRIINQALEIANNLNFKNIKLLEIEKSLDWNFQLANVIWNAYKKASYDYILTYDVDSILTKNVLLGLNEIGENNVAVVSFTKKLRIKLPQEIVRHIIYRLMVRKLNYVFSGIYWIYRPYYFDSIPLEKYKAIFNGIDIILCDEILSKNKYKIITRKEIGVKCLDIQNGDLPWRQFQLGIWIGANKLDLIQQRKQIIEYVKQNNIKTKLKLRGHVSMVNSELDCQLKSNRTFFIAKYFGHMHPEFAYYIIKMTPSVLVLLRSLLWFHPHLFRGYLWARRHPEHPVVKMAKNMNKNDWEMLGSKHITQRKWKQKGTGFV